jgi:hypothetical protein
MQLRRVAVVLALAGMAGWTGLGDASARQPRAASLALEECRERFVVAPGDDAAVRRRVPPQYELSRDASGRPLLYITAITCARYVVGRSAAPTTAAAFAAMVKSPDGVGCASAWPVVGDVKGDALSCNLYVLFAAYDNPAVVSWLRAGTPDLPVHFVERLDFDESRFDLATLGQRLKFQAGRGTPSRFRLDGVVRERMVASPLTSTFWAETSSGTVRIRFHSPALALGEAQATLTTAPGSEMARLLGTERAAGAQPFTLIAGNRWAHGSLTKSVLPGRQSSGEERR